MENYVENLSCCGKACGKLKKLWKTSYKIILKNHLTTIPPYDILQLQSNETLTLKQEGMKQYKMIKVTLELDYPNFQEANEKDPHLSSLISSDKCISFERKEEVPSVKEFMALRNNKFKELFANMNIDPENAEPTMKKAIEQMAYEWTANNYYYHYSKVGKGSNNSTTKY